jgi:hypothetical protein
MKKKIFLLNIDAAIVIVFAVAFGLLATRYSQAAAEQAEKYIETNDQFFLMASKIFLTEMWISIGLFVVITLFAIGLANAIILRQLKNKIIALLIFITFIVGLGAFLALLFAISTSFVQDNHVVIAVVLILIIFIANTPIHILQRYKNNIERSNVCIKKQKL